MNNWDSIHKKELLVLTLAFAMPLLVLSLIFFQEDKKEIVEKPQLKKEQKAYIFEPNIKAKSAMVTELNTGKVLYAFNEKDQRPIASITKLMTTLVATEKFESQSISRIQINENHLKPLGDNGLVVGQVWKVKDLIDFTLITSSNDGARALALSAFGERSENFVSEMNLFAKKLGLANTFFANETGLDINELTDESGAISSAEDITKVLKYILMNKPEVFQESTKPAKTIESNGIVYNIENTNKSLTKLPNPILSKTGYTDIAGGNLAVIVNFGLNNPVSIVVLGSTLESRETDVLNLIEETKNYYLSTLKE